jgi:type IV pilus assembly protein PilC
MNKKDSGKEKKRKSLKSLQRITISTSNLLISIKSLAALLKASLALSETIKTMSEQSNDQNLNHIYRYIHGEIEKGSTLSEAMKLFPKVFSETVVSVVDAGERGGSLETNLIFIADSIKKEHELNRKLKGALIYPLIIISMTLAEFIGMIFIVLPKMENLFSSFPNIPKLTVFSINFPILKKLFTSNILASFSRTLSVLLASAIPIETALAISSSTMSNYIYSNIIKDIQKNVVEGKNLADSLAQYKKYFNPSFIKMIDIGEISGTLEENLMYLHEYYADDVTEMSNNIITFIEPLLLIFVGVIIGVLGLTILMPIYQLMNSINA